MYPLNTLPHLFTHLGGSLFAFIGAGENIHRDRDPEGPFLWALVYVHPPQVHVDSGCPPGKKSKCILGVLF